MSRRRRRKIPQEPVELVIESLSHEGRGISHVEGKTVFADMALPGESISFRYRRTHSRYSEGSCEEVLSGHSPDRVEPKCRHFSKCGGCSLQHLSPEKQIQHKEQVLKEQLTHIGGVNALQIMPPLKGPLWGYRHKARLGVKYVVKKEKVLVGFREKYSSFVADIDGCEVLHPKVGKLIEQLAELISTLSVYNKIAQIEVAVAEERTALIFRNLAELVSEDVKKLSDFSEFHAVDIYLQSGGPDTVLSLSGEKQSRLNYTLEEGGVSIEFEPGDFTQVNVDINQKMVRRVVELMDLTPNDRILDLFCGLGNFTLPLAKRALSVTGVEGSEALVHRASENAGINQISNTRFYAADLNETSINSLVNVDDYNKLLLDPPRSGAQKIVEQMEKGMFEKIIYVSCNPATLARDAGILVKEKSYQLVAAGVMDMFPHTTHVESIAVFEPV